MGMFSWKCRRCERSILGPFSLPAICAWMNDAVVLLPPTSTRLNTSVLVGEYDGYGRIEGGSVHETGTPEMYHRACWELAGKPMVFTQASDGADDQGYFYDDADYQVPDPRENSNG